MVEEMIYDRAPRFSALLSVECGRKRFVGGRAFSSLGGLVKTRGVMIADCDFYTKRAFPRHRPLRGPSKLLVDTLVRSKLKIIPDFDFAEVSFYSLTSVGTKAKKQAPVTRESSQGLTVFGKLTRG